MTLVHSYLRFSQQQLAPFVEANPGYLVDLERAYRVLSVDHEAPKAHPGIFLHIFFLSFVLKRAYRVLSCDREAPRAHIGVTLSPSHLLSHSLAHITDTKALQAHYTHITLSLSLSLSHTHTHTHTLQTGRRCGC